MNWYEEHTITVTDLRVANYMIDHGSEMIGLENVPEKLTDARMRFRSENVHRAFGEATTRYLPPLTGEENTRIRSMLALLTVVKEKQLAEEQGANHE